MNNTTSSSMQHDIDIEKIEKLLSAKKYDEVKFLIKEAVDKKFSSKERGAALVAAASLYIQVSNKIQARYRDLLREAVMGVKKLKDSERQVADRVQLDDVREGLKS